VNKGLKKILKGKSKKELKELISQFYQRLEDFEDVSIMDSENYEDIDKSYIYCCHSGDVYMEEESRYEFERHFKSKYPTLQILSEINRCNTFRGEEPFIFSLREPYFRDMLGEIRFDMKKMGVEANYPVEPSCKESVIYKGVEIRKV